MNDTKELDIPWLRIHFGDQEEPAETEPDPDFVTMLEELEFR